MVLQIQIQIHVRLIKIHILSSLTSYMSFPKHFSIFAKSLSDSTSTCDLFNMGPCHHPLNGYTYFTKERDDNQSDN